MFLINCVQDKSYVIRDDSDVIYNEDVPVKKGDTVIFKFHGKSYKGEVILKSDDEDFVITQFKKYINNKKKMDESSKRTHTPTDEKLRKRISVKRSYSSAELEESKKKKTGYDSKDTKSKAKSRKEAKDKDKKIRNALREQVSSANQRLFSVNIDDDLANESNDRFTSIDMKVTKTGRKVAVSALKALQTFKQSSKAGLKPSPTKEELKTMLEQANKEKDRMINAMMNRTKGALKEIVAQDFSTMDDVLDINFVETVDSAEQEGKKAEEENGDKNGKIPPTKAMIDDSDNKSNYSTDQEKCTDKNPSSDCSDEHNHSDEVEDQQQLFGKNCTNDKMINLGKNIYCQAKILSYARGASHKATHVARKLMKGVFKLEALLTSTLTGQEPRAVGKQNYSNPPTSLNAKARDVIIEYSQTLAKENNWEPCTEKQIKQALTQLLGEIKRDHRAVLKRTSNSGSTKTSLA